MPGYGGYGTPVLALTDSPYNPAIGGYGGMGA